MTTIEFINTVLLCTGLYVYGIYIYELLINKKGVPNVTTVAPARRKIIETLKNDAAANPGKPYVIMDLGSGRGTLTRAMAKAMPGSRITGVEIAPLRHARARIVQMLCDPRNLSYQKTDFFTCDIAAADAIILYLRVNMMNAISRKLLNEARPGALIISNAFPLPEDHWPDRQTIRIKTLYPQKTLYIYKKKDEAP